MLFDLDQPVVVLVRPDPEPGDVIVLDNADGSIVTRYSDGIDWLGRMNALEVQAGMIWI